MSGTKTVGADIDLYTSQVEDVAAMRTSLLSFNKSDPNAARKAIQNVTILRVYHQLSRIVRYTEMMDKIEDRIYQSIDMKLMNSDPDDDSIWSTLIPIQERLQQMMIASHKLLEPYLNMEQLATFEVEQKEDPADTFTAMILDQESREKVRTGVQEVMAILTTVDDLKDLKEVPLQEVQSKAQEALAELTGESDG